MKLFKLLSVAVMMTSLASCSNDDDPTNLAQGTTGSYEGYTVASCAYFSNMAAIDQTVKLTSSTINKVDISYESDTWGTITISDADLSGVEGNLSISGSGKSLMAHAGNAANEYDCTVTGTLINKVLSLTFSCPSIMGGLKIEFNQGEIPASIVVPGTYSGYTDASSAYFPSMTDDDQQIVITKNDGDTYKIVFISETWGEFTIDSATAQYSNGTFTVTGSGTCQMGMNGNIRDYDCTVTGTIDVEKEDPTFTFTVPSVMGGLTIEFHTGDAPSSDEE